MRLVGAFEQCDLGFEFSCRRPAMVEESATTLRMAFVEPDFLKRGLSVLRHRDVV